MSWLFLIAISAVTALTLTEVLLAECVDVPAMLWIGTNGAEGGLHGNEGARTSVEAISGQTIGSDYFVAVAADWDPTRGVLVRSSRGNLDLSIFKTSPTGDLLWAATVGGEQLDAATSLVAFEDMVYYVGSFGQYCDGYTVDFDPTDEGVDYHSCRGSGRTDDLFISSIVDHGNRFSYQWTVTLGGDKFDVARSIDILPGGSLVIVGYYSATVDFDPGPDEAFRTSNGGDDAFILVLTPDAEFVSVQTFGGPRSDSAMQVIVGPAGNFFVVGEFNATVDFDPGPGEDFHTATSNDLFVSAYDAAGNYLWTNALELYFTPNGTRIDVDRQGRILLGSSFERTVDLDPGPGQYIVASRGGSDGFVSLWSPEGQHLWSRRIGGTGYDGVQQAVFDGDGRILVGGAFHDTVDFDEDGTPDLRTSRGGFDCFLSRWTPEGRSEWTLDWGGPEEEDFVTHLATHDNGDITVSGLFQGAVDFDPHAGEYHLSAVGNRDMYLMRLSCGEGCDELLAHSARGRTGKVISRVATGVPGGRVAVDCTGQNGRQRRARPLGENGKARIKVKRLFPGDYVCTVTHLDDGAGHTLCDGAFAPVTVSVP